MYAGSAHLPPYFPVAIDGNDRFVSCLYLARVTLAVPSEHRSVNEVILSLVRIKDRQISVRQCLLRWCDSRVVKGQVNEVDRKQRDILQCDPYRGPTPRQRQDRAPNAKRSPLAIIQHQRAMRQRRPPYPQQRLLRHNLTLHKPRLHTTPRRSRDTRPRHPLLPRSRLEPRPL